MGISDKYENDQWAVCISQYSWNTYGLYEQAEWTVQLYQHDLRGDNRNIKKIQFVTLAVESPTNMSRLINITFVVGSSLKITT